MHKFLIMAIRYVTIQSASDLEERWTDSNCPNFDWGYIEQDISECPEVSGGFQASYETLEVATGEQMSFTYLCADTESTKSYTITAGEYGVKPS